MSWRTAYVYQLFITGADQDDRKKEGFIFFNSCEPNGFKTLIQRQFTGWSEIQVMGVLRRTLYHW